MTIGLGSTLGVLGFRRRHLCSGGIIPGGGFIPVLPCNDLVSRGLPAQAVPLGTSNPLTTPGASILSNGGPQSVRVDASLNVVVGIGETLSVFATVDGVQQGAPILTFAGTGAAASAAGFGVVSVPDGVHTIGIQLVSSAPAAVLSGTLTAAGCLSGEVEQG